MVIQREPAIRQIRSALEPLLKPHGFRYDERTNAQADRDRPWLLFHADPPDRLVEVHPGYATHLLRSYEQQETATCLDIWVGDSSDTERHSWRIDGDVRLDDRDVSELQSVQHDPVEVWLPIATRVLGDWFAAVDERFPPGGPHA